MAVQREILQFETAEAWEQWLAAHADASAGVALKLAKKGSAFSTPTHAEALDVALCHGWIDGVRNALDADFFLQTFMPRTKRSTWSQVNRDKVAALIDAGKLRVEVAGTYSLADTAAAYRELETGHVRGKLVIVP